MNRIIFFLFVLLFISCNDEKKVSKFDFSINEWIEKARDHSINLVYDISQPKNEKIKYIGTVIASRPFISYSSCYLDSIPKTSFLLSYLNEEDISFLESQLRFSPYAWSQDEFKFKKIVGKEILDLHNPKCLYDNNELDTLFWKSMKAEFNSEDIHVVYRPLFTKDFKYAIITIEYYSLFDGNTWFNGCSTLFCKNEDGYWVIIDKLAHAVA